MTQLNSRDFNHEPSKAKVLAPPKMNPKVVAWMALAVTTVAICSFGLMFLIAAERNGWW